MKNKDYQMSKPQTLFAFLVGKEIIIIVGILLFIYNFFE